jgi:hypothetical protein
MVGVIPVMGSETAGVHPGGLGEGEFGQQSAAGEGLSFRSAKDEALGFVELAVRRVAEGEGGDAGPGLELAAEDLHRAAAMIVGGHGAEGIDVRRRRLLLDAARRFRARLDAACPSRGARLRPS